MGKHNQSLKFARFTATSLVFLLGALTVVNGISLLRSESDPLRTPAQPEPDFSAALALPATSEEKLHSLDEAARAEGAAELVSTIEQSWPDDHRRVFLTAIAPGALQSAIEHCVPPSVTLAQAIQESGWGRSGLARNHQNLFGVKASSGGVVLPTREVEQGKALRVKARFAAFDDWQGSVTHHNELIAEDPRYAAARDGWDNWPSFLAALGPVYATDPAYVRRVSRLVVDYRLDRFDDLVTKAARKQASCAHL